jgi:hypothetical protein
MGEKRPEPARPPSKKAETDRLDEALKATFPASSLAALGEGQAFLSSLTLTKKS